MEELNMIKIDKFSYCLVGLLIISPLLSGCATHKTYKETTTVSNAGTKSSEPAQSGTETTTVTEETTTSTKEHSGGVISGFFGFLGKVIAFPFKVVGGIIEAIF